ncbi:MAG: hypothetical protein ACYDAR_12830 [Thermomicrobiales bacterium]
MTIALIPHRTDARGRLTRVRSVMGDVVANFPVRRPEPQPTVNAGRWAVLPGEYAGPWACPLDERLPVIVTPGITAPIACGQSGAVVLHLAGDWSGHVAFEGSMDGVIWFRIMLTSLSSDGASDETDCPGLWRTLPGEQIAAIRLHVARLPRGAILASVAAAPCVGQPIPRALDPAA